MARRTDVEPFELALRLAAPRPGHDCVEMNNGRFGQWQPASCAQRNAFICEAEASADPELPDLADCAILAAGGAWTNADCTTARPLVCETAPAGAELEFADLARDVRDDYRTGARRIGHAAFSGDVAPQKLFSRYLDQFGLRPCVDSLAEVGPSRPIGANLGQGWKQTYRGLPVQARGYLVERDATSGAIRAVTGRAEHGIDVDPAPAVLETSARAIAAAAIGRAPAASPIGELVVFPSGGGPRPEWRLAWTFEFPSIGGEQKYAVVVGADRPDLLAIVGSDRSDCPSYAITGAEGPLAAIDVTAYQQRPPISDDSTTLVTPTGDAALPYALFDNGTPRVYGLCGASMYPSVAAIDHQPLDVDWSSSEDEFLAATYLALQNNILANSNLFTNAGGDPWIGIDGAGATDVRIEMRDHAESPAGAARALYSATRGAIRINPHTVESTFLGASLEVMGHELSHAILQTFIGSTALWTDVEFRSIDEGFASVMGETSEIYFRGLGTAVPDFCVHGELNVLNGTSRSCTLDMIRPADSVMAHCEARDASGNLIHPVCPADYRGPNYCAMPFDADQPNGTCGAHRNSSILLHWFYLLSMGDAGVNAMECGYSVAPLRADPRESAYAAAQLLFRAMRDHAFDPATGYEGLADSTITAATAIYGAGSPELASVEDAWFAVNVKQESDFEATIRAVEPARAVEDIHPWVTFRWPIHPGEVGWDLQISDGPFTGASLLLDRANIRTIERLGEGEFVGTTEVAFPELSARRYFWRVRPHSTSPWRDCHPIHAFDRTVAIGELTNLAIGTQTPEGFVRPGRISAGFDRVPGTQRYRIFVATHDADCSPGPGVIEREFVPHREGRDYPPRASTAITGIQPSTHYHLSAQAIGPEDFSGVPSTSPCLKAEFDTTELEAPHVAPDDLAQYFEYHGEVELRWGVRDGAEASLVRFYELDELGFCDAVLIHSELVFDPCSDSCSRSVQNPAFPYRNPTGYCWDVIASAANGGVSPPSPLARFGFTHRPLLPIAPGVHAFYTMFDRVPSPLPGDSYGMPVEFEFQGDPTAVNYILKVGRYPWRTPASTPDPVNCFPGSCTIDTWEVTHREEVTEATVTLPGEVASMGRYCWQAWPIEEHPLTPGVAGVQPFLNVTPGTWCYTSGPARPEIIFDSPAPADTFTGEPITGRIRFPYVPDDQYLVNVSSSDVQLGDGCAYEPHAWVYRDIYDCEIPFTIEPEEGATYELRARTWNSEAPGMPVLDDASLIHDETALIQFQRCGATGEFCCPDERCDLRGRHCVDGRCELCGNEGDLCCHQDDGFDCYRGMECSSADRCVRCGSTGDRCCSDGSCEFGNTCRAGTCVDSSPEPGGRECNALYEQGGVNPETHTIELGQTSGTVTLFWNSLIIPDNITVTYEGNTIGSGCFSTERLIDACDFTTGWCCDPESAFCYVRIDYNGSSSSMTVHVDPNCAEPGITEWEFMLTCP